MCRGDMLVEGAIRIPVHTALHLVCAPLHLSVPAVLLPSSVFCLLCVCSACSVRWGCRSKHPCKNIRVETQKKHDSPAGGETF